MSDRQKLFYALLASAFFHIAIGLILAFWTAEHSADVAKALPDLSQLTVTIMPSRPAPAAPVVSKPPVIATAPTPVPAPGMPPVIDSDGLTPSSKAPANPVFQSDANMVAGSRLPARGNLPLPTMDGPKRNFTDFADRSSSVGKGEQPVPASPARRAMDAARGMPLQTPSAITEVEHSSGSPARPTPASTAAPVAQSTPAPTPRPQPTAAPDTLALGKPAPTPPPPSQLPKPLEELARLNTAPSLRANPEMIPMTRPQAPPSPQSQPQPPSPGAPQPSTQREMEKTRVDGGITTEGAPGVDAGETPYGRYHHKLYNLIGSRWNLYVKEHPKDVGEVTIRVTLAPSGRVVDARVTENHAADDLADLSTRAIMDSDLPPVPDDLAPMLRNGRLEVSFTFDIYDPNQ